MQYNTKIQVTLSKVKVSVVRESGLTDKAISCGQHIASIVRAYIDDDPREHFVACYLNAKHKLIGIHTVSIGTLNGATVHPREVFSPALSLPTTCIIVAHNHPSGDVTPSKDDESLTERLMHAGEILGIPVLDHIIIGHDKFYSFADKIRYAYTA